MNSLWKSTKSGLLNILSPAVSAFTKQILTSNSEFITERRTPGQLLVGRRAYFIDRIQRYLSLAGSLGITIEKSPITEMKSIGYLKFSNNSVNGPIVMRTGKRSFTELVEEFVYHNRDNKWVRFYGRIFGYDLDDSLDETQLDRGILKVDSIEGKKYVIFNCNDYLFNN